MSTVKDVAHTPGPWDRGPYVGDNIHVITTTDQPWVGRIVAKVPALNLVDGEGNACLIAAAPLMLDTLKALEAYMGDACDFGILDRHPVHALWLQTRAAIAKAEGTTP